MSSVYPSHCAITIATVRFYLKYPLHTFILDICGIYNIFLLPKSTKLVCLWRVTLRSNIQPPNRPLVIKVPRTHYDDGNRQRDDPVNPKLFRDA
jgi:hypothetical protein